MNLEGTIVVIATLAKSVLLALADIALRRHSTEAENALRYFPLMLVFTCVCASEPEPESGPEPEPKEDADLWLALELNHLEQSTFPVLLRPCVSFVVVRLDSASDFGVGTFAVAIAVMEIEPHKYEPTHPFTTASPHSGPYNPPGNGLTMRPLVSSSRATWHNMIRLDSNPGSSRSPFRHQDQEVSSLGSNSERAPSLLQRMDLMQPDRNVST